MSYPFANEDDSLMLNSERERPEQRGGGKEGLRSSEEMCNSFAMIRY